jgi:hypothetical protein
MGGTISITLRKPDGTEYRMQRWTNPISFWLNNVRFVEENKQHIHEFLQIWLDMKADYDRHQVDQQFENPMTNVYFPSCGLVPCGYGLIVMDMQKKVILDCFQDYTDIGQVPVIKFILLLQQCNYNLAALEKEYREELAWLSEPFKKKRFIRLYGHKEGKIFDWPIPATFDAYHKMITPATVRNDPLSFAQFDLDMSPYTIERYEYKDAQKAHDRVVALGFTLSPQEEAIWQREITEYLRPRREE